MLGVSFTCTWSRYCLLLDDWKSLCTGVPSTQIVEHVRKGDDERIHVGHGYKIGVQICGDRLFFRITTWPSNTLAYYPRAFAFFDLSQPLSVSHDANGLVTALGGTSTSVARGMRGSSFFVYKTDGHGHEDDETDRWTQNRPIGGGFADSPPNYREFLSTMNPVSHVITEAIAAFTTNNETKTPAPTISRYQNMGPHGIVPLVDDENSDMRGIGTSRMITCRRSVNFPPPFRPMMPYASVRDAPELRSQWSSQAVARRYMQGGLSQGRRREVRSHCQRADLGWTMIERQRR